ncbi:MAG: hypothetical protein IJK88_07430 [Clostridia bacterium]|nr:hypothetical protein [Clostridia bacterium]
MIKQYKLNSQRIIRLNPPKEFPVIGIKITEEAYVEDFVKKGIIHFSNPQIDPFSKSTNLNKEAKATLTDCRGLFAVKKI